MKDIEQRIVRIESRLVQIMLHMGLDPYKKSYDSLEDANRANVSRKEGKKVDSKY